MKPRNLRHRLEKAAKLLVLVQKHLPDADVQYAEAKAEHGELVVSCGDAYSPPENFPKLGRDLESRGFSFRRTDTPWLGLRTWRGKKDSQPDVVLQLAIQTDRSALSSDSGPHPFSFREKK